MPYQLINVFEMLEQTRITLGYCNEIRSQLDLRQSLFNVVFSSNQSLCSRENTVQHG